MSIFPLTASNFTKEFGTQIGTQNYRNNKCWLNAKETTERRGTYINFSVFLDRNRVNLVRVPM